MPRFATMTFGRYHAPTPSTRSGAPERRSAHRRMPASPPRRRVRWVLPLRSRPPRLRSMAPASMRRRRSAAWTATGSPMTAATATGGATPTATGVRETAARPPTPGEATNGGSSLSTPYSVICSHGPDDRTNLRRPLFPTRRRQHLAREHTALAHPASSRHPLLRGALCTRDRQIAVTFAPHGRSGDVSWWAADRSGAGSPTAPAAPAATRAVRNQVRCGTAAAPR